MISAPGQSRYQPGSHAPIEDGLNSKTPSVHAGGGEEGRSELPELPGVVKSLLAFTIAAFMCGPFRVLCDVDSEVLEAAHPLNRGPVGARGGSSSVELPLKSITASLLLLMLRGMEQTRHYHTRWSTPFRFKLLSSPEIYPPAVYPPQTAQSSRLGAQSSGAFEQSPGVLQTNPLGGPDTFWCQA